MIEHEEFLALLEELLELEQGSIKASDQLDQLDHLAQLAQLAQRFIYISSAIQLLYDQFLVSQIIRYIV